MPAGFAVAGEVKLFTPSSLTGCGDRDPKFHLVRLQVGPDTVHLPSFAGVRASLYWAFRRADRRTSDRRSNNGLEDVYCFLRRTVIDVVNPFPPQQEVGQTLRCQCSVLE